jgi:hypothetical protein
MFGIYEDYCPVAKCNKKAFYQEYMSNVASSLKKTDNL